MNPDKLLLLFNQAYIALAKLAGHKRAVQSDIDRDARLLRQFMERVNDAIHRPQEPELIEAAISPSPEIQALLDNPLANH